MRWHLLALSLAMLVPMLAFASLEVFRATQAERSADVAHMQLLALTNADRVEQGVTVLMAKADVLANSPDLHARDLAGFRRAAEEVALNTGAMVVLRNQDGAQVVSTRVAANEALPTMPAEDPAAREAIRANRPFVSDLFSTGVVHPFMARVVVPAVFGSGLGAVRGYAVELQFTPEMVVGWLPASARDPGWSVTVIGRNGIIIARTEALDTYVGRGTASDVFGPMHNVASGWRGLQVDGTWLTGSYTVLPRCGWIVAVGQPEPVFSGVTVSVIWLAATAVLLMGLGILLSSLLARRLARGVGTLVQAAQTLGAGVPVPRTTLPVLEFEAVRHALAGAGQEIRDRTASEYALLVEVRRSRDLLQAVVNGTADPIFARDLDGRFVVMNQAGARSLGGVASEDVEGRSIDALLPPDRLQAARAWDWLATVSTGTMTVPLSLLDGQADSTRLYQVSKAPWRDPSGEVAGMVCIARDVTDQANAAARLQTLQSNLARAGRLSAVAAMAAGLAHELNQPLAAATNFMAAADTLLTTVGCSPPDGDPEAIKEALAEASDQVVRAASIVRRLRAFIGKEDVVTEDQVLAPLLEAAAVAAWRYGAPAGASLHFCLDPAVTALVDPVQVQQVVSNLVRNAAEALRSAPGLSRQEVWVGVERVADGAAMVSVVDTGPGLDASRRDRLFDVLEGSSKPGGMGVGLAICRTIVAAHGGELWAEDTVGGGASFLFTLPPTPTLPYQERLDDHSFA